VESIVQYLSQVNPVVAYLTIAAIAFTENIFPPFPSDILVVAGGSLIGLGRIDFLTALIAASVGGTLGFMLMFQVGKWFGKSIIEKNKLKFHSLKGLHIVEAWFKKYGYGIVVANRFLSGTRAIISFFAGMSELSLVKTTVLSFISSLVWNFLLLLGGYALGEHWRRIEIYLDTYGKIITIVAVVLIVCFFLARMTMRGMKNKKTAE
jgi:membrane protein DedA with SNARE-associated domain